MTSVGPRPVTILFEMTANRGTVFDRDAVLVEIVHIVAADGDLRRAGGLVLDEDGEARLAPLEPRREQLILRRAAADRATGVLVVNPDQLQTAGLDIVVRTVDDQILDIDFHGRTRRHENSARLPGWPDNVVVFCTAPPAGKATVGDAWFGTLDSVMAFATTTCSA